MFSWINFLKVLFEMPPVFQLMLSQQCGVLIIVLVHVQHYTTTEQAGHHWYKQLGVTEFADRGVILGTIRTWTSSLSTAQAVHAIVLLQPWNITYIRYLIHKNDQHCPMYYPWCLVITYFDYQCKLCALVCGCWGQNEHDEKIHTLALRTAPLSHFCLPL